MDRKDLISVIVPVYNVENYLERCVNSIRNQTYTQLEIILVDDGSTDSSPGLCDAYAGQDSRIKVVHKENGGLSDARNAGLEAATGAYIGYVDSDDWIEADMYEQMYTACIEHDAQLAACRYFSEYQDRTISGGSGKNILLTREELLQIYICGHEKYIIYNSVWSKLFRRELVENMVFPKGRNSEDIMYTTRAFCSLKRAVYIDKCLYHYVLDRKGSIMNAAKGERMFRDEIPFWREHIAWIKETVSDGMANLAAYYFYRRLLAYYLALFSDKHTRADAKRLAEMMRGEQTEICRVYASNTSKGSNTTKGSRGDAVRMKVFLRNPVLYYALNKLYEMIVIPLKTRGR